MAQPKLEFRLRFPLAEDRNHPDHFDAIQEVYGGDDYTAVVGQSSRIFEAVEAACKEAGVRVISAYLEDPHNGNGLIITGTLAQIERLRQVKPQWATLKQTSLRGDVN